VPVPVYIDLLCTAPHRTVAVVASKKRRSLVNPSPRGKRRKRLWWDRKSFDELLDVRLCDLDLTLQGSTLQARIDRLHEELRRAGLSFRPHVWLSTDWFTPDGVGGIAVPFFLAHKRLVQLEHTKMLEVEGGTQTWCMKLLRHEAGHAIDNAYRLHWKKKWRETFGRFSDKYGSEYAPDPESRNFVHHLGYWYSQSHPAEDYAESFAVWLRPGARWRTRYKGWPVYKKLESLNEMMQSIGGEKPVVNSRARPDSLPTLKMTLREYYEEKQQTFADATPEAVDAYLFRLFSAGEEPSIKREKAAAFLRRFRIELRNRIAHLTRQPKYLVDQALDVLIVRCRELDLRVTRSTQESRVDATILLTIMTMRFVTGKRPRYRR
jgi:hypothetical protein